ncbi:hypothetical protein QFC21_007087 [Naganishia friedmannii]|uniref:Uncharacterized protein n=1 Tax=Naganishia friedmannii TaxID=89922 RepID=A0ACC2UYG3_9TREE|nr:hypothetical protein QFC21_007087 [Naganishia friedmannii]
MSLFNSDYQPISTAAPATATTVAPAVSSPSEPAAASTPTPVKGKAVTYSGTYNVGLVDVSVPKLVEDDDVVLKVTATTLCGSDLHLWHGETAGIPAGTVVGHECVGIVDKVGSGVKSLKEGDMLKSFIKVPMADFNCLKIPDEVPDEKALFLSDVLPAAYHCVKDTGIKDGDIVGIWGLGPIGQAAVRFAALAGARRIYAIDKVDSRLALARQGGKPGVVHTINYQQLEELDDVVEFIQAKCPEGLDCAIDATSTHEPKAEKALRLESDNPNVVNECIRSVRKMGRAPPVHLYWQEILDKIVSDEFDPTFLITQRIRLEDLPEFYPVWASRVPSIQKVFVVTRFGPEQACPGTPALASTQQLERLDGGRRRSSLLVTVQQMGGRRRSSFLQSMLSEGKTYLDKALGTAQ